MSIINENNLNNYIQEFIIILKEYKNNKNNLNIDTDITDKINIKLLNENLNCNIISDIVKDNNKKLQFKKEIQDKLIGSIIQKYVEKFEIDKIFDNLISTIEKQGSGLYNIITDPEQLELALEILSKGNLAAGFSKPITFAKLTSNLELLNKGNLDMKKIWSGQAAIEIQQKFVSKAMDFTNLINKIMVSKNSGSLNPKEAIELYNEFKLLIDKKFGQKEKDLFNLLISDKANFYKVFSLIISKLNIKIQNECNNLNDDERKEFEEILKTEVEYFNNNRITFILKVIKNKLGDKFKSSGSNLIQNVTGLNVDKVKQSVTGEINECLNNPEKCEKKVQNVVNTVQKFAGKFAGIKI
jgi:hypothetical protein